MPYFLIKENFLFVSVLLGLLLVTILLYQEVLKKIRSNSFIKILFWLTIISAFGGPVFFAIPLGPYHLLLFRIFLPFILFLILLQILLNKGKISISLKKIKFYILFLIIWFSYAILTLIWAQSTINALKDIFFLFTSFITIFLIILYLKTVHDLKQFYVLWIIVLIFLIGIGLWEMFTGNRLHSSGYFATEWADKKIWPSAVFHNTNDFASYLTLSIPFIWAWLRYGTRKTLKWIVNIILLISILFLLVKIDSRINYLTVALEIIFILFCLLKTNKKIKATFAIGVIAVLIFIFYPQFFAIPREFFKSLVTPYELAYGSPGARLNVMKNSLRACFDSFGFGVGAGNIAPYIARYAKYPIIGGILAPHNWWVEILANYGIFIFAGYLLFYFSLIYNLWKIWHKISERWDKILCETILIALIGFSLAAVGPSSMMQLDYHWMLFGFALAFLNYYRLKYKGARTRI